MRKEFRSLISLEEAKSIVLSHLPQTATEDVSLERARGRVLAEKIISSLDVPSFHRASMDGYAVRSEDTLASREDRPVGLRLAGSVPMGRLTDLQVDQGEAAEVSTGSMMPGGADAVVMIEYIQAKGDCVYVHRPVHDGENMQAASSDISFGEAVLFPGTRLNARELGVLAAIGREKVKVRSLKGVLPPPATNSSPLAAFWAQGKSTTLTPIQSQPAYGNAEPKHSVTVSSPMRRLRWQRCCKRWLKNAT